MESWSFSFRWNLGPLNPQLGKGCLPGAGVHSQAPAKKRTPKIQPPQASHPTPQSPLLRGSRQRSPLTPFPPPLSKGESSELRNSVWGGFFFFFFIVRTQIQQCDKCIRATIRKIYSIRTRRSGQRGETRALQSPSYVSHYVTLVMGRQPDSK